MPRRSSIVCTMMFFAFISAVSGCSSATNPTLVPHTRAAGSKPSVPNVASPTWIDLLPSGVPPAARILASAVYDPNSDNMTIFAGCSNGFCFNDVWVLNSADGHSATSWTQLNPVGGPPSQRGAPTTVYDPDSNNMIVFGGDTHEGLCFQDANDLWVLNGANGIGTATWTQLDPTGTPPSPRDGHTSVYDATTNRMIVFGGDDACPPLFNDVWVVSNANGMGGTPAWTKLAVSGKSPGVRKEHSAVYDPSSNSMIIFGGVNRFNALSDVWVLRRANGVAPGESPRWEQLSPAGGPGPRFGHSAVFDGATNRMYVFGGTGPGGPANDVWMLSHANGTGGAPTWHQLTPIGGPPGAREYATAVFDSRRGHRMTIFSGGDGVTYYNDAWALTGVH